MIFKKKNILLLFLALPILTTAITVSKITKKDQNQKEPENSKKLNLKINRITIKSENRKLERIFLKKIQPYQGQIFSKELSDKIHNQILSILKTQKIFLPKIEGPSFIGDGNTLEIAYEIKNPYQYGFILSGNKSLEQYKLIPKKTTKRYFNNSQFIEKIQAQIKESYLKKGYSNIKQEYKIKIDERNFIKTIYINIEEGVQTKIEKIKLFGQFSRPRSYYINLIYDYSSPLIRKKLFYNPDLQEGLKNLLNLLRNEGYLQAKALARVTQIEDHKVTVDVILNEGPGVKIKKINFIGNKYFSSRKLIRLMKIKVNNILNIKHLETDIETIVNTYRNTGFIKMDLVNRDKVVEYNKKEASVVLNFNILENTRVKISDIIVQGNIVTKTDFIINSLSIKKEEILTPQKIEKSIQQLRTLGIFSSINMLIGKEGKNQKKETLIIKVEERKPRSIRAALGINTERTLTARGLAEYSHRNIKGTGKHMFSRLKLQSNIAQYAQISSSEPEHLEHQVSLGYIEPLLFGSRFNGQISLSNSDQIFAYDRTEEGNITDIVNSTKINILLKTIVLNFVTINWTLFGWEGRTDFKKSTACETINPDLCDSNTLNLATTALSLNIDKRDQILSPSRGFLSQVFLEYSGTFYFVHSSDEIQFIKMEVKHFDFRPIYPKWVWTNSLQAGFIANINNLEQGGFPVSRAFILGGVNSLRGFDGLIHSERIPDKDELSIEDANELIYSRSSFYLLLRTELRFPISRNFNGSLFYDGGVVTISGRRFTRPYRHSSGVGIRYKTPLGPIAGYIAFKIDPKPQESPVRLHLSFGSF